MMVNVTQNGVLVQRLQTIEAESKAVFAIVENCQHDGSAKHLVLYF
jgi:hypothetical protein